MHYRLDSNSQVVWCVVRVYLRDGELFNEEQSHYVRNVMRKSGQVHCFNEGGEWRCDITGKKIEQVRWPESVPKTTICVGMIKKPRLEILVEKLTEVGVTDLKLLETDHTQKHFYDMQRLQKISIEAAEQCGRLTPLKIHAPGVFADILQALPAESTAFCHKKGTRSPNGHIDTLLIGPEGGWSAREFELLSSFRSINLGQTTLRTETACIIAGYLLQNG